MVKRQFNSKVKIIRTDNAFELGYGNIQSKKFISKGIIHQTTCVHTPQQNEEKTQAFIEKIKSSFISISPSYWLLGVMLVTITYLINIFPSTFKFKNSF